MVTGDSQTIHNNTEPDYSLSSPAHSRATQAECTNSRQELTIPPISSQSLAQSSIPRSKTTPTIHQNDATPTPDVKLNGKAICISRCCQPFSASFQSFPHPRHQPVVYIPSNSITLISAKTTQLPLRYLPPPT